MTPPTPAARYEAAERLLPHRWKELVFSGLVRPRWIENENRFWYRNAGRSGGEFILVDPESRTRESAFDHEQVATSLGAALARELDPSNLPVRGVEFRPGRFLLHVDEQVWECDRSTWGVTLAPESAPAPGESISPDGRWAVRVEDHNLVLRERATGDERPLTDDGVDGYSYGTPPDLGAGRLLLERVGLPSPIAVVWSPDSSRLLSHRIDQRSLPFIHYVQASPADGGRPRLHHQRYPMVGEAELAMAALVVIEIETGRSTWADSEPIPVKTLSPLARRRAWWDRDSRHAYVVWGGRADRTVQLSEFDSATGRVRTLVTETSDTQAQTHPLGYGFPNVRVLASGETIWWSERSGWGHLYLYGPDGSSRPLTGGAWLVRDLVAVDEDARVAVFTGSGRERDLDPYVRQVYRVGLDDCTVERLSADVVDHEIFPSPSGQCLVDVTSNVNTPATSVLRDVSGEITLELERADAALLYEAGWKPPERFTVKAADGVTDLYGLLYTPPDFDTSERYPVLDDIYPGPQSNNAHIRFPCSGGLVVSQAASIAALGFAVVVLDGRGTPLRDKAFQEHCRGLRDGENLDDHVAAIRQLATTRLWMDIDRVGIFGVSGGGRASTQALLRHPDFFKVAVSASGNHDDLMYSPSWGEKYVGFPDEIDYGEHANATHVARLEGKLLLIHGELDDNVTSYLTLRLVDALIAANKDFDLLIVPNGDHGIWLNHAYTLRRGWDYVVRHLRGEEPPAYRITDIPLDLDALAEGQ